MKPVAISVKDAYQISSAPADALEGGVFTDIVLLAAENAASSGNRDEAAPHEALRHFHTLAIGFLREEGAKTAHAQGKLVWSWFSSAQDALAAAMNLHRRFDAHGNAHPGSPLIRLRTALHQGDAVLADQEISGAAVSLLTRLLPELAPRTLSLTRSVRDRLPDDKALKCIPHASPPADLGTELFLYEWNRRRGPAAGSHKEPGLFLYIRPVRAMAGESFRRTWRRLLRRYGNAGDAGATPPLSASRKDSDAAVLPDQSLLFTPAAPEKALRLARLFLDHLEAYPEYGGVVPPPVQILLDFSTFLQWRQDRLRVSAMEWRLIEPGRIHLSDTAYRRLEMVPGFTADPLSANPRIFRLTDGKDLAEKGAAGRLFAPFPHAGALAEGGSHNPCFYCDSRRHEPSACPTKQRDRRLWALDRLSCLPPDEIRRLFYHHIMKTEPDAGPPPEDLPLSLAEEAFDELRYIHQLRFFETIWGSSATRWDDILPPAVERKGGTGGQAWLAHDCIRSGNYQRAAQLLNTAMQDAPTDFRLYCSLGFLSIETGRPDQARKYLEQGCYYAASIPQRIFIRLLICRIALLQGGMDALTAPLEEAVSLDAECTDIRYLRGIFLFHAGKAGAARGVFESLIAENRRYFAQVMIDPLLARFANEVHRLLHPIYCRAGSEAFEAGERLDRELERLGAILGRDKRILSRMEAEWKKVRQTAEQGGYGAYLDVVRTARSLYARSRRLIVRKKEQAFQQLDELQNRSNELAEFMGKPTLSGVIGNQYKRLGEIRNEIAGIRKHIRLEKPEAFVSFSRKTTDIARFLDNLDFKVRILVNFRQAGAFMGVFFKLCLLLQALNIAMGFWVIPGLIKGMGALAGFSVPGAHIQFCQFGSLMIGGMFAFLFAVYRGLRKMELN